MMDLIKFPFFFFNFNSKNSRDFLFLQSVRNDVCLGASVVYDDEIVGSVSGPSGNIYYKYL